MRKDDSDSKNFFRTDRFFVVSGQWHFTTREGEDFGPFGSRDEAEEKLRDYLDTQSVMHRLRDRDPSLEDTNHSDVKKIAELSREIQNERGNEES
jgi:hypothetical protein